MSLPSISLLELVRARNSKGVEQLLPSLSGFEVADFLAVRDDEDFDYVFKLLPPQLAADTYQYLSRKMQKEALKVLSPLQVAAMLKSMQLDDTIALLEEFPRKTIDKYVLLLPSEMQIQIAKVLGYPKESTGRLMTSAYITVKKDWSVEHVIEHIRSLHGKNNRSNDLYVIDDKGFPLYRVDIKEFFLYPKDAKVNQIPHKKIVPLCALDPDIKAVQRFKHCRNFSLPVVDLNGHMIGIITMDDILRLASRQNTERFHKIGGVEALDESYMDTSFFHLFQKRSHWLVLLFLGEMLTATAMGFFEAEIAKAVVLALFLPLIISSGGNAGSQSTTLIIRAMALGEIKVKQWWTIFRREILMGLCLGLFLGLIGFARVTLWSVFSDIYGAHWLLIAITIFLALIGVVLWGSLVGAMLPFLLRKLGVDPAASSGPLVATLVDVTGIIIYFSIAMWVLRGVML